MSGGSGLRRCPTLVGRADEVSFLSGAVAGLQAGRGCGIVVAGEAGIGKSRLVEWLVEHARADGGEVVVGRAVDAGRPVALAALQGALLGSTKLLRSIDDPDLAQLAPLLAHLVPTACPRAPDPTPTLIGHAALQGLAAASPGVTVVLEDLHAADGDTVTAVLHMLARANDVPVLVVATTRRERAGAQIVSSARSVGAEVLSLGRLSDQDMQEMATALLSSDEADDPPPVSVELGIAEGLPLLVEDLLAARMDAGDDAFRAHGTPTSSVAVSDRFDELVRSRIASLDATTTRVVTAAGLLGPLLSDGLLPMAAGLSPDEVRAALAEAAAAQILSLDGTRFRHALTRDAVVAATPLFERVAAARRVAAELHDPPGEVLAEAAEVLVVAGQPERAAELLLRSAHVERGTGSYEAAASRLRRGLEIQPTGEVAADLRLLLISTLVDQGMHVEAAGLVEAAAATMPADWRLEATLVVAAGAAEAADGALTARHLADAEALLGSRPQPPRLVLLQSVAMLQFSAELDRRDQAEMQARAAANAATEAGDQAVACEAWLTVGRCVRFRDLRQAPEAYEQALAIATRDGFARQRLQALHELGTLDILTWGTPRRLELARDLATSTGALATSVSILLNLAGCYLIVGEWARAAASADDARALAERLGFEHGAAMARVWAAGAAGFAGDVERAEREFHAIIEAHADDVTVTMAAEVHGLLFLAALADDLDELERICRRSRPQTELMDYAPCWLLLIEAKLGRIDAAAVRAAIGDGPTAALPTALRALEQSALAIAVGRTDPLAAENIMEALEPDMNSGVPYAGIMMRHVAEAALDDGWGDPGSWLVDVHEMAAGSGHERLLSAVRRLLRRTGAPLPRLTARSNSVPDELLLLGVTPREWEVLSHFATSPTNAELAGAMHVSVRTMEKHISSLLLKLRVHSRRELARMALDNGWRPVQVRSED